MAKAKTKTTLQSVEDSIRSMQAQFGEHALMRLGQQKAVQVDIIPTGSLALDAALGIGGYPVGRIVEIYGPEQSGKTTLALHALANAQGRTPSKVAAHESEVAFIDMEHALDPTYAASIGVDLDRVIFSQPDSGEQALDIMYTLVRMSTVGLVVLDSVAALVPKAELDGEAGAGQPGMQARLMGQALRKLTAVASRNNVLLIFINQLRMKIGVMFGSPEITSGGQALKYYASIRLDVRRRDKIDEEGEQVGRLTKVKVVKNKFFPPFREAFFDIRYGFGIDQASDAFAMAISLGIITKAGSWYSFDGVQLGQGVRNAEVALKENPELMAKMQQNVREQFAVAR